MSRALCEWHRAVWCPVVFCRVLSYSVVSCRVLSCPVVSGPTRGVLGGIDHSHVAAALWRQYDPVAAAACDGDGVFWMRFSTMLQYFGHTPSSFSSAMSVCWRPLRHHSTVHRACTPSDADGGRDYSQVRHLPQFRVEVTVPSGGSGTASPPPPVTVMLHLERHIASARHDSSVTAEESAATRDTVPAGVVRLRTASINRGTPASTSPSGGGAAAGAGTAIVGGRSSHTSSEIVGLAVYGADAHTASVTGDERSVALAVDDAAEAAAFDLRVT